MCLKRHGICKDIRLKISKMYHNISSVIPDQYMLDLRKIKTSYGIYTKGNCFRWDLNRRFWILGTKYMHWDRYGKQYKQIIPEYISPCEICLLQLTHDKCKCDIKEEKCANHNVFAPYLCNYCHTLGCILCLNVAHRRHINNDNNTNMCLYHTDKEKKSSESETSIFVPIFHICVVSITLLLTYAFEQYVP